MKRALAFGLATAALIGATAWLAIAVVFKNLTRQEADAIVMSAGVAFTVQMLTFGVARALVPANLMAGWGAGMLIRFVTLVLHGFLGARLLGLPQGAALVSLAAFFFLTTIIEPFFLGSPPGGGAAPARSERPE